MAKRNWNIITFGKYQFSTIQEVAEKDFSYILWLLNYSDLHPQRRKIILALPQYKSWLAQQEEKKKENSNSKSSLE